jgi:YggT family protein
MTFVIFHTLKTLVDLVLDLCWFVVIAAVIASWLIAFGVLNMNNQYVRQMVRALDSITEPVFRRVRRVIPPIGGLDLSPVIVLFAIILLQVFLDDLLTYLMFR